jgi:hypothetical protein
MLSLVSCEENTWDVLVDTNAIKLDVVNVDSAYMNTDEGQINDLNKHLMKELGEAYKVEVSNNIYHPFDSAAPYMLKKFYENEFIAALEKEKLKLEKERRKQIESFEESLSYLSYHFPGIKLPKQVVLMNNMFSGVLLSDEQLFVGLERFLSSESDLVQSVPSDQLHNWQKEDMDIAYLARDMALPWIQVQLFKQEDEHLAFHIVQAGKVLTVLQAAFPKQSETFILRYSEKDMEWANQNEELFWDYLVKEQKLFVNDVRDKANFLNEAPYTVGLPDKGPDRMGQFLGFQMVKSYLKQNKDLSLQELLETNFNDILQAYEI